MKKLVMLAVVVGLALALAVPAMAVDLTATGFIGVSGTVFKNIPPAVPGYYFPTATAGPRTDQLNKIGSYLAMRGRLGFNLRASEDLYGFFMFEMDSNRFGEWGGGNGSRNQMGTFGADRNSVEIKSVYINFRIPPKLPVWARVGLQTYVLRPQAGFMLFDAAGVALRSTIDPIKLNITGYFAKMLDATPGQVTAPPDDRAFWEAVTGSELYALDMNIPLTFSPKFSIKPGAFFVYQTIRMNGSNEGMGGTSTPPGLDSTAYPINKFGIGTDDAYLYWLGAYLNGKLGPLPMELDFIWQGGQVHYTDAVYDHTTLGSFLFRGWISYVFKGLEVGGGGMYVQGENYNKYQNATQPAQYVAQAGARSSRFILPQPAVDAPPGDSVVYTGGWMGTGINAHVGAFLAPNGELPGFWYARGYAYYKVFPWLKLGAQLMYLAGTDRYEDGYPYVEYIGGNRDGGHNNIGWEMDYGVNVQIYKNLAFNGAFGYLFAEKQLSLTGGRAMSDPWQFCGLLLYTF